MAPFSQAHAPVPLARAGGKSVLLVEDNPDDEALTVRALSRHGFNQRLHVVRDGAEALDYLLPAAGAAAAAAPGLPSVVLLDLKLPKLDGLEVLRELRRHDRTKKVPVVILTSSREEQDMLHGYDLGANSYVRKPVEFAAFTEAVCQIGLYWLLLNENPFR